MSDQYYDQQHDQSYDGAEHDQQQQQHGHSGYTNDTPAPVSSNPNGNGTGYPSNGAPTSAGAPAQYAPQVKQEYEPPAKPTVMQSAKKQLASWVGFSNLPNQVHRRANK
jgi:hypothetical protein